MPGGHRGQSSTAGPDPLSIDALRPMLLTEAKRPWADDEFQAELKHDGYRLLVEIDGANVTLRTRNGANATDWYPELQSLARLTSTRTILDGEVCVLDEIGRSDFNRLHARSLRRGWQAGADQVVFIPFDVLVHRGLDVRTRPLRSRKTLLQKLPLSGRPNVLLCQHVPGSQAPELYAAAVQLKLEGIVMKRISSLYVGGEPRTGDWVKIKRPGATPPQRFDRGDLSL